MKYNLRAERIEYHIGVNYCSPRSNQYQWGGYSGMDLAVDEQGLWVLCGTTNNDKRLTAGKIDAETNNIARNFYLSTGEHVFLMRQQLIQLASSLALGGLVNCGPFFYRD